MTVSELESVRPAAARTVSVRYAGGEQRHGPVTMGQANMIRCILRDDPTHINIHDVWPVPPGTGLEAVIDALRALVVRHEGLRTTFPARPDGPPQEQRVAAEGAFTVTVLDHESLPGDPAPYAESVARGARAGRFRLDRDFPLRVTLIARGGEPLFVALAASHAVTDGSALGVLREEWLALLAGGSPPPLATLTPLDLADEEATPAGLRRSEASLRYWERIMRTGPQAMFAEPGAAGTDVRTPQLTLRSRRGAEALARVADRTGAVPSTVLLTAWCTLIAHRTGQDACVVAVPTSNRFVSLLARSVNTLSQDSLLCLDVRQPSFDALLRRAWGAALSAYRHSRFDALALWEMIGRVGFERGSNFARDVVFNDVSRLPSAPTAPAATAGSPGPELELTRGPDQVLPTRALTFVYETDPLLRLSMWADPALFPGDRAEAFLTGLVLLLEAAAADDVPLSSLTEVTGVRPVERAGDWRRVDNCWVSPAAVAEALSRVLDGVPVHIAVEGPDPAGRSVLTAYITAGTTPLSPVQAHAALMEALPGRPGVLAPHRYVIVDDPPSRAGDDGARFGRRILAEGDGRNRPISDDH
ncbi:condensation domain-containing protein [Streptomyces qinzhouensis]|uniref:Condensation protein n=1 Tax=Streptomyces qinzhouensis TaxID=2599401 RepID=A0A5B8JRC0_9ACTN|nr:condensation domain-containing protein [Streptomyces qinzhouensis]QDY80520.1 condensation protein [Streptomyces qinzhouensis]